MSTRSIRFIRFLERPFSVAAGSHREDMKKSHRRTKRIFVPRKRNEKRMAVFPIASLFSALSMVIAPNFHFPRRLFPELFPLVLDAFPGKQFNARGAPSRSRSIPEVERRGSTPPRHMSWRFLSGYRRSRSTCPDVLSSGIAEHPVFFMGSPGDMSRRHFPSPI